MLVGLCPNPLCSASGGCRLRIPAERFFNLSADACGVGTFCTDGFPEAENSAMQHIRDCAILDYINLFVLNSRMCSWLHEPFVFPYPATPIAKNSR